MKEKEIIKSELLNIKKISRIIIIIGIVLGFIAFFIIARSDKQALTNAFCSSNYTLVGTKKIYTGESKNCTEYKNMSLFEYIGGRNQNSYWFALFGIILSSIAISVAFKKAYKDNEIIITNKRVYGIGKFGKKFDFSLDNITSINTTFLKGIKIDISPKPKTFYMIKNNNEIYESISTLIRKK